MVHIISEWYYEMDEFQYVLIRKYMKRKGIFGQTGKYSDEMVEKKDEVGYYHTLESMMKGLARIMVKEKYDRGEIKTIRDHIQALQDLQEELRDLLRSE